MNMNRIGFVILTWNSEKYISECLDSIRKLENCIKDVAVVDNGSSDNTTKYIEEFKSCGDFYVHLIRHSHNLGTTTTRNEAIRYLCERNVDYFCILDSDATVNQEVIDKLIETLKNNSKCLVAGPKLLLEDGNVQISARNFPTVKEKLMKIIPLEKAQIKADELSNTTVKDEYQYSDYLIGAFWLMKREATNIVGYFNERFFFAPEDAEYCLRIWKKGYEVIYVQSAIAYHVSQRISRKKFFSKHNAAHVCGLLYFFIKYRRDIRRIHNSIHES